MLSRVNTSDRNKHKYTTQPTIASGIDENDRVSIRDDRAGRQLISRSSKPEEGAVEKIAIGGSNDQLECPNRRVYGLEPGNGI